MLKILEERLKQEREQSELVPLTEDFFIQLQEHIHVLKSAHDPLSQRKLQLIEEQMEKLIDVRAEKIVQGHHTGMLKAESKLADYALTFKKFKKDVLKSLLQKETTAQKVTVLEDLPQFYGPELEVLGPYKKGEVVLMERTVATLLKERGLVEEKEVT